MWILLLRTCKLWKYITPKIYQPLAESEGMEMMGTISFEARDCVTIWLDSAYGLDNEA